MRTLVRNGTVVTPSGTVAADVLIEGEVIAAVTPHLQADADRTVDAAGRLVLPGGVDVHTHLDMPYGAFTTSDDFESGTVAAAFGGTTTIVDFAVQDHGASLHHAVETWKAKARGRAAVDYGFHVIITDLTGAGEREMDELVADGVTSFKLFTAYPGRLMVDDAAIFRALLRSAANGGTVMVHAENGGVIEVLQQRALASGRSDALQHARTRPARAEAEATHRVIALAELAGAPVYIVHVSAAETVEEIVAARRRGVAVHGETCPQYLFLTERAYEDDGPRYMMSPPLRDEPSQERLWSALAAGDLEAVATDHCPFTLADKHAHGDFTRVPGGVPGIEDRMSLLFDGGVAGRRFPLERFVELTSAGPARLFGLWPRKGAIAPGSDADLVVWNAERERTISAKTHHMHVDYNPYEGRVVKGVAELVLSRGRPVVEAGRFAGRAGAGEFLRRAGR